MQVCHRHNKREHACFWISSVQPSHSWRCKLFARKHVASLEGLLNYWQLNVSVSSWSFQKKAQNSNLPTSFVHFLVLVFVAFSWASCLEIDVFKVANLTTEDDRAFRVRVDKGWTVAMGQPFNIWVLIHCFAATWSSSRCMDVIRWTMMVKVVDESIG